MYNYIRRMSDNRNYACLLCDAVGKCRVCNKLCRDVTTDECKLMCKAFDLGYRYAAMKGQLSQLKS
jgi:hypothetical protein